MENSQQQPVHCFNLPTVTTHLQAALQPYPHLLFHAASVTVITAADVCSHVSFCCSSCLQISAVKDPEQTHFTKCTLIIRGLSSCWLSSAAVDTVIAIVADRDRLVFDFCPSMSLNWLSRRRWIDGKHQTPFHFTGIV